MCVTQSEVPSFASQCDDIVQCNQYLDRCMTVNGSMSIPGVGSLPFIMRNCSGFDACDPQSEANSKCPVHLLLLEMRCKRRNK